MTLEDDQLYHYGTKRHSGRYPWGSGGLENQGNQDFMAAVSSMRKSGMTEAQIAKAVGMTRPEMQAKKAIIKSEQKAADIAMAQRLSDKQMSTEAIARRMGKPASTVRALLKEGSAEKSDRLSNVASALIKEVDEKGVIDVGKGVNLHMNVSEQTLSTAIAMAKEAGYVTHNVQIDQLGTTNKTRVTVLAKPGTEYKDIVKDKSQIKSVVAKFEDNGRSVLGIHPPISVDSKRIQVLYKEDGGDKADGVIYVRPGAKDLSLNGSKYAQVRVAVDGTHYLKGMALLKDDLPPGVDIQFNTPKSKTSVSSKKDVFKEMKDDPDNPFGSVVKQIKALDPKTGKEKVVSAMNIVNESDDWASWSKNLSSQVLSKQAPKLAEAQLKKTFDKRQAELDEIMSLNNVAVRKKLLQSYADGVDTDAVKLKAHALPRQSTRVLLPLNTIKESEIYAPNFRDGERVALIRFPHGGKFEIPELTVNNRHPEGKKLLGDLDVAVGINHKTAARLSGADFDGDTVLVIPNPISNPKIKTAPPLKGLKNFDPQDSFPGYDGMRTIDGGTYNATTKKVEYGSRGKNPNGKGREMGRVSNLITDMTIRNASPDEIAAAVRHSMVVIDSEKHVLNYKESERANGIPALMKKYQGKSTGGASTLISLAGSETRPLERTPRSMKDGGPIDKKTGKKVYTYTGREYVDPKTGKTVKVLGPKTKKLYEVDDAHDLSSGTAVEKVYADHSNSMKALANRARKELASSGNIKQSSSAKTVYAAEVRSLTSKLRAAQMNAPLERAAQIAAAANVKAKMDSNPDLTKAEIKKIKGQALVESRARLSASKPKVDITRKEWEAIQAGAISNKKLDDILSNADLDVVKGYATPRVTKLMTPAKMSQAKSMAANGLSQQQIADALGVSLTTLKEGLSGG